MRIDYDPKLDFDDVLIRPKRSEAPSRSAVDLERQYTFLNSGRRWKGIPLVASNMDTVGTMTMADALAPQMLTCLHKYYPLDQLIDFFTSNPASQSTFYTLGIRAEDFDKLKMFVSKAGEKARFPRVVGNLGSASRSLETEGKGER